jgi:hypothetical protein
MLSVRPSMATPRCGYLVRKATSLSRLPPAPACKAASLLANSQPRAVRNGRGGLAFRDIGLAGAGVQASGFTWLAELGALVLGEAGLGHGPGGIHLQLAPCRAPPPRAERGEQGRRPPPRDDARREKRDSGISRRITVARSGLPGAGNLQRDEQHRRCQQDADESAHHHGLRATSRRRRRVRKTLSMRSPAGEAEHAPPDSQHGRAAPERSVRERTLARLNQCGEA